MTCEVCGSRWHTRIFHLVKDARPEWVRRAMDARLPVRIEGGVSR